MRPKSSKWILSDAIMIEYNAPQIAYFKKEAIWEGKNQGMKQRHTLLPPRIVLKFDHLRQKDNACNMVNHISIITNLVIFFEEVNHQIHEIVQG